jgi:hypothetical protein
MPSVRKKIRFSSPSKTEVVSTQSRLLVLRACCKGAGTVVCGGKWNRCVGLLCVLCTECSTEAQLAVVFVRVVHVN